MSFSSPIAEKIYLFMDAICSPIENFFKDFHSELNEVWLQKKSSSKQEEEPEEEKKFDTDQALLKLKSFKSIKKATILFFGIENSGKTSFLKRFTTKSFDSQVKPTNGFNIFDLQFHGFMLTCWDFGGDKRVREYWENYLNNEISGIIYVVDGNDEKKIQENFDVLVFLINLIVNLLKKELPILIFVNKSDLELKISTAKFAEDIQKATNYEGVILAEEGSVLRWNNIEESIGSFLEFIR